MLPSFAAIASLLASAYTLYFLPLPPQQISIIDGSQLNKQQGGRRGGGSTATATKHKLGSYGFSSPSTTRETQATVSAAERPPVPYISDELAEWLAAYLTAGNVAVAGCLALHEAWKGTEWGNSFVIEGGYLPVLICFIVLWARRELRVIDMSGLEKLKALGREDGKML